MTFFWACVLFGVGCLAGAVLVNETIVRSTDRRLAFTQQALDEATVQIGSLHAHNASLALRLVEQAAQGAEPAEPPLLCAYCGETAEGRYSIHRDGFGEGPEVPLCDGCGSGPRPTAGRIWARIAQPSDSECAFWPTREA